MAIEPPRSLRRTALEPPSRQTIDFHSQDHKAYVDTSTS